MCRLCALFAITLAPGLWGAGITVRFDPASPDVGPFPGNAVTVPDGAQKTGQRINLPLPDCRTFASACGEITALNEFDGFSVDPRIRVRFSGPVNVDTLREGIFFVALDNLTNEEFGLGSAGAADFSIALDRGDRLEYRHADAGRGGGLADDLADHLAHTGGAAHDDVQPAASAALDNPTACAILATYRNRYERT